MDKHYLFYNKSINMKVHKFRIVFLLLFSVFLANISVAQPGGSGRSIYLVAEELRKQNRCSDAIQKYEEAIKLEPTNYKYYFQKGLCEQKDKKLEDAKKSFQKSIDNNREYTPAYAQMAKLFKDEKDIDNTIYYYELAAENERITGRKVQYELILVNLLLKQNKNADAKRHWEEAQKIDPGNMKVLYYAGEIKAAEENWASAKDDYLAATETPSFASISPAEKAQYYYALGLSYYKLNDIDNAKRAWSKANYGPYQQLINQQLMKSNNVYYYKIAASYYLSDEFEDAETNLQKSLEIQPNFTGAYVLRAKIARKQNDIRGTIENFQKAIEVEKDATTKAKLYNMLAMMQMQNNDYFGALASLNEAIAAIPSNKNLVYMKAKALYASGRYADAYKELEDLMTSASDAKAKAKFAFVMGKAAKKNGDLEGAKKSFQAAMYGPYKPSARIELDKLTGKSE